MQPNPGYCPPEADGCDEGKTYRVRVRLRNGKVPGESWPATGRGACRWTLTGDPWDIVAWKIEG